MKIFRFEMKRAFVNTWFIISLAMGIAICVADCILFLKQHRDYNDNALIQMWIGTDYQFAYNSLFYILLPIIASLPYAGTCFSDIKSGYDRNICIKTSRLRYVTAKAVAVFASGASAVGIPLLVDLFICAGFCPDKLPDKLSFLYAGVIDCNLFPMLFALHPALYCIIFILLDSVFGGLTGLVAMSVARWSGSQFSAIMGPFALYLFTGVLFEGNGLGTWSALSMVNPTQNVVTYGYQIVTMCVALCVVPITMIYIWHRRRDII
jgi:hypothetical protein